MSGHGVGHPHDGRQARRPRTPHRRGRQRRITRRGRTAARAGQDDRPRAGARAARRGQFHRDRRVLPASLHRVRHGQAPSLRRRGHHRHGRDQWATGLRVQSGRRDFRRITGPGLRREDLQDHRLRAQDGLPPHRHQRGRRSADPGGRRLARALRRDLPPQHPRVGRDPADLAGDGRGRRRPCLLPRAHRLHRHGRPDVADVHHRTRRDPHGHRRRRDHGGAGRRAHPQRGVGHRPLSRRQRGRRARIRARPAQSPSAEQPRGPSDLRRRGRHHDHRPRPRPRRADPRLPQPALRHA